MFLILRFGYFKFRSFNCFFNIYFLHTTGILKTVPLRMKKSHGSIHVQVQLIPCFVSFGR